MELEFPAATFRAVKKAGAKSEVFRSDIDYDTDVDSKHILPVDYGIIRKAIGDPKGASIENKRILRKLDALEAFQKADHRTARVTKLELLPDALKRLIGKTKHRWIFVESGGSLLPYFVTKIKFHPAENDRGNYTPAYVRLSTEAVSRGRGAGRSIDFERANLVGSAIEILGLKNAVIETDDLVSAYEKDMALYRDWKVKTGEQFLARGTGEVMDGDWREGSVSLDRDDTASKVVMDDDINWGKDDGMADTDFWVEEGVDNDADDADSFPKPVHPILRIFNLGTHEFVETHVSSLKPYAYNEKISEKLVLPPESRQLIDILTSGAVKKMDDIVKGKAAGIVVICSGKPGTGKTLTAEVYSEAARRPLYTVQCSQLGTDEEALEKKLANVLERATRWRAILLIDEADVYIHERGESIRQNAIVGVFLRLLEYYSGILFLTTNRVTIIDDAILSRATAHVKYKVLEGEQYTKLWHILLMQYGVTHAGGIHTLIRDAVKAFPRASGRSVRQLIRLAKMMHPSENINVSHLKAVAAFHDFTELAGDYQGDTGRPGGLSY